MKAPGQTCVCVPFVYFSDLNMDYKKYLALFDNIKSSLSSKLPFQSDILFQTMRKITHKLIKNEI